MTPIIISNPWGEVGGGAGTATRRQSILSYRFLKNTTWGPLHHPKQMNWNLCAHIWNTQFTHKDAIYLFLGCFLQPLWASVQKTWERECTRSWTMAGHVNAVTWKKEGPLSGTKMPDDFRLASLEPGPQAEGEESFPVYRGEVRRAMEARAGTCLRIVDWNLSSHFRWVSVCSVPVNFYRNQGEGWV